ncbi:MAG: DUF4837 family protein [Candidatus Electryonea clarkiae]|nr:DUF4837 family protein [Candidatus Electryonea clarkiae]MDP8286040.1 DUF4837 family protein [Candidatus Electryonea clarkiae]
MKVIAMRSTGFHKSIQILILLSSLIIIGCGGFKPGAVEGDKSVAVITEGSHAEIIRTLLTKTLEREILTPQPEKHFELFFGGDDSLSSYSLWSNVILAGALDSDDKVSARLGDMLKGESLEGVSQELYFIFRKQNLWARGQTVIFLVAATRADLALWIENNGDELYKILSDDRNERMKKTLFAHKEQKKLADSLRTAHGWSFRIQHDYQLVTSQRSPNIIRLRRRLPDRYLTVAWRIGDPKEVCIDSLIAWRNSIGKKFADPSKINKNYIKVTESSISDVPAVRVEGLWETIGNLGGGPFVSYIFHSGGTLYFIEGAVFAPDREKELFVRQLDIILNTFELPPE